MDIEHEAQFGRLYNKYCNYIMDNMTIHNGDDLVMAVERGDLLDEFAAMIGEIDVAAKENEKCLPL